MLDIFDRIERDSGGPIGQYFSQAYGYYMYPRLEGELGPHMIFNGTEVLNWSLNNYLGLANHPEVRKADAEAAAKWGLAYPMGARMLSGNTRYHEKLEKMFAEFEKKEDAFLYNFGYQGIVSTIDALTARHDVIVYDAECHACLLDGIRLHIGSKYKYRHNNIEDCEKVLARACAEADANGGGVLLITEGVYGMTGALGILDKIAALKKKYTFRFMIDDAHGFGLLGEHGRGTSEALHCMDEVDLISVRSLSLWLLSVDLSLVLTRLSTTSVRTCVHRCMRNHFLCRSLSVIPNFCKSSCHRKATNPARSAGLLPTLSRTVSGKKDSISERQRLA